MRRKSPLTPRQRVSVLNAAIQSCHTMHGSVTGDPEYQHTAEPQHCQCEYGITIRGLKSMRREAYAAIAQTKKAVRK